MQRQSRTTRRILYELASCRAFLNETHGHASVEHGLLLSFIGGAVLAGAIALGASISGSMSGTATLIASAEPGVADTSSAADRSAKEDDEAGGHNGKSQAGANPKSQGSSNGKSSIRGQLNAVTVQKQGGRKN